MRDPKRIDKFGLELSRMWKTHCPDWRFGQFLFNVLSDYGNNIFFIEDDEMLMIFKRYFKEVKNVKKNRKKKVS